MAPPLISKWSSTKKLKWSFLESGFSWFSFATTIACACLCISIVQSLVVSRYKCISPQAMVTESTESSFSTPKVPRSDSTVPVTPPWKERHENLSRMVFAIAAAAQYWPNRKAYIKKWYNSVKSLRAIVWLDQEVNGNSSWEQDDDASMPPLRISGDTSQFAYTFKGGKRSGIRIARIVAETVRLEMADVDWFIMGDDDTVFFPNNLAQVLSKYDPRHMYYIGSNSETHMQNIVFSYNMAFGGGGFAISSPLAKELAHMQDSCLLRYSHLFGSDDRIFACMSELGVSLTNERGFHQMDIQGDALGLLAAHPQAPLVSIHHMELFSPIFPNHTRQEAVDHLLSAARVESSSLLQQSMCYAANHSWSFSVSWGYVVQAYKGFLSPRELETPLRTFYTLRRRRDRTDFPFNTRPPPKDQCMRPSLYFMTSVKQNSSIISVQSDRLPHFSLLESVYSARDYWNRRRACAKDLLPLSSVRRIRVFKEPVKHSWFQAPRRLCCRAWNKDSIELELSECRRGETLSVTQTA